jgi:hypothetical protein
LAIRARGEGTEREDAPKSERLRASTLELGEGLMKNKTCPKGKNKDSENALSVAHVK